MHKLSRQTLRLVTWNVQGAAETRACAQVAWLAGRHDADFVVLTEVRSTKGGCSLIRALEGSGYTVIEAQGSEDGYSVVCASRVGTIESTSVSVDHLPRRFLALRLTLGSSRVGIVGIYVPSRGPQGRRNLDKRTFQAAVSSLLPTLRRRLGCDFLVVAGDLNVIEPEHKPTYRTFACWEYDFYTDFASHGLIDAFRALNPAAQDHSWFGRSGNGYRFDHIFVSRTHAGLLRECQYVHGPREARLSDHAAMTLSLVLPP